jgi:hypothetical protein
VAASDSLIEAGQTGLEDDIKQATDQMATFLADRRM